VDDERSIRRALRQVTERTFGATVFEAGSTDEAMRVLRDQDVDLVLTDINHPGDGVHLVRLIREDPRCADVPVLVQSAAIPGREREARQAGARVFLAKPYTLATLSRAIGQALGSTRLPEPDIALIELGTEMQTHDYKGAITLATAKQRASFAKDVIAMANSGGGTIVVGVEETAPGRFEPTGLTEEQQGALETTRLYNAVKSFMDPPVPVVTRRVRYMARNFVFVEVPSAGSELVMAARDHQDAGLYRTRVYGRTAGAESAALDHPAEIRAVINRIVEARLRERATH
jgi:CheY-like chemotaxis protein